MPLSTLELVSTLFGRLSFGFSVWFALPQIGKLYKKGRMHPKESIEEGPSFVLLWFWLIGDLAQMVGLFVIGGLSTQKASTIVFAISSLIIMLQLYYYRGYMPFTDRRKARLGKKPIVSSLMHGIHHLPAYTVEAATPSKKSFKRTKAHDLEKGRSRSGSSRSQYRQLSVPKRKDSHPPSSKLSPRWKDFDGWRINSLGFVIVTAIMLVVWYLADFERRQTGDLEVALPPSTLPEKLGWYVGWSGTALYTYARWHQLAIILIRKSVAAIAAFSFGSLVLQNITMLILSSASQTEQVERLIFEALLRIRFSQSILAVSHTLDTTYAQAPYLANLAFALSGDVVFLILYYRYRNNKPSTGSKQSWSDPLWMYQDYPSRTSPPHAAKGKRAVVQKHQQDLHQLLLPVPTRRSDDSQHDSEAVSRERILRGEVAENARQHLREHIDRLEMEAVEAEQKWMTDQSSLPWMVKGRAAGKLNKFEKEEVKAWDRLSKASGGISEEERKEQGRWFANAAKRRKALEDLRQERRTLMANSGRSSSSSMEEQESTSDSDSSSGDVRRSLHRPGRRSILDSVRRSSVGSANAHPRRGVGTSSERSSEESSGWEKENESSRR